MSVITSQPTNLNFLQNTGFKFTLTRAPALSYFCQQAAIPGLTISSANQPTPLINRPLPGDKLTYEALQLQFTIDEDLANWLEVYNWMVGLGHPKSLSQYKTLNQSEHGIRSDGILTILSSHLNARFEVTFEEIYPESLSGINFTSTAPTTEYPTAVASFRYTMYTIARANES